MKKKESVESLRRLIEWVICFYNACGPDNECDEDKDNDDEAKVEALTRRISFTCIIVNGVYTHPHPPPPSQHNRNGSMVHQLLSAFVPLTPRLWQHWVYSFKWAFAHSLRITTTASVLPGLLSNWTAKRSLKKTSSSVLKNKLVWFLNCCVELSEISACLCVLRIQKKRVPDAEEGWNKSIHEERKMKCVCLWGCERVCGCTGVPLMWRFVFQNWDKVDQMQESAASQQVSGRIDGAWTGCR